MPSILPIFFKIKPFVIFLLPLPFNSFYFQISNCRHSPSHFLFYLVTLTRCWQSFVQVFSLFPSESVPVIFKRTTVKLLRRTESFKTKCDTHNRTAFYLSSSARPGSLAAEKSLVIKRCLKSGRSQAAVTAGWLKSEVRWMEPAELPQKGSCKPNGAAIRIQCTAKLP